MANSFRFSAYSLVAGALVAVACSSSSVSDERVCEPAESRSCTCDNGLPGNQVCNRSGSDFTICQCGGGTGGSPPVGTGGSPATGGSAGAGGSMAGAGGSAGADTDGGGGAAGGDAGEMPDGGDEMPDASVDAPSSTDGGGDAGLCATTLDDGGALNACDLCLAQSCCEVGLACSAPDPCLEPGDAGFSEFDCMVVCLGDIVAMDGGTVGQGELDGCVSDCGAGAVTDVFFSCIVGSCGTECGYQ